MKRTQAISRLQLLLNTLSRPSAACPPLRKMSTSEPRPLKILMLHGYTQSGPLFQAKSSALRKAIQKAFPPPAYAVHLSYPSGSMVLQPFDIPGFDPANHTTPDDTIEAFGWWRRKDPAETGKTAIVYLGIEKGLAGIAETIRAEGPFDGAIGFSQGGCAAGLVATLLEPGRPAAFEAARSKDPEKMAYPPEFLDAATGKQIQPPLKFVVIYSGFRPPDDLYSAFYEPKPVTPSAHFIGSLDTVVDESRTKALADAWSGESSKVFVHPGGHFLPSQRIWLDAVVGFIRESLNRGKTLQRKGNITSEQSAEDMDVPF